jgi:hypothetical protein
MPRSKETDKCQTNERFLNLIMPVSFLTQSERERLQSFPKEISDEDLTAFFTLSDTDKALAQKQHGDHNRLGFVM